MSAHIEKLLDCLHNILKNRVSVHCDRCAQVRVDCKPADYLDVARMLKTHPDLSFEQLTDLSGIDYGEFTGWTGPRFAVVSHLLSVRHNVRLRLRVFPEDQTAPQVPSLSPVWMGADWYEREAYDLFGILFVGHADLRRILTDYGFVGHPLRKDFPVSGHVEMRFDPEKQTLVYEPVTLEPRVVTPRIVREQGFSHRQREAREETDHG
jgi:NADH-quinone oxidoreductase subunit C